MAFAISAYFPLGFYQGSDSGGRPEEFPSLCRLYSALVSVAYLTFGFEQVDANRNLTDDQIREALNWLEDNPPQGMLLPHAVKADSRAVAYRNKGNVQNRKKPKDKVSSTTAHIATAYEQHPESGRLLTWIWHECPSSTARMVLSWLCNEVPYLGEACSPVELNTYEDYVIDADFKQRYSQQIRDDVVKLNPGFLILIPSDMSKGDIGKLRDVCAGAEGKSLYYAPEKSTLRIGKVTTVDAEHFWKPVAPGMCRYWAVRPMAIAETRPIPDIKLHRKWGVYEALCLSIGHVWRSQYPQSSEGSREERYWNIVDVVSAKTSHFRIYNYRTVHRANMTDYVHRANGSNILHGMNALIAISDAGESLDCAAMAIGQSRHLGGGFLVPADFAVSVCQSDDDFEKGIPTWLK